MQKAILSLLCLLLCLCPAMLLGQGKGTTDSTDVYGIGNPQETIARHWYYLKEGDNPVKSAQALFKGPIGETQIDQARKLKQIYLAAGLRVKPELIPDEPNYKDSSLNAHRYIIFPNTFPELYVQRSVEQLTDSTQVITWRYAPKSVAMIDEIHDRTIPMGTHALMNIIGGIGGRTFLGLMLWQYIGIFLAGLTCFLLYILMDRLFGLVIRRIVPKLFPTSFLNRELIPPLTHPLSWLIMLLILREWLVPSLLLPIGLGEWVVLILKIVPSVFGVLVFYRLIDILANLFTNLTAKTDTTMDDQLVPLLSTAAKLAVITFGIIFVLQNLDVNVTALLAGVSIGGLAIALAAQDTVKNFIGSLSIFVDRPFTVGDFIDTGSFSGVVTQVGVRSTRLRASDGAMVSVPNGRLVDMTITNHGIRTYRRFATTLTVSYGTSPDLMEAFVNGVREIALKHPQSADDSVTVQFHEMADSSLNIFFAVILDTVAYGDWLKARQELLLEIIRFAEDKGISFAFPSTSVYVESLPSNQSPLTSNQSLV